MNIQINIDIIPYVIKNDLHVEYFIWCFLRSVNSTGLYTKKNLSGAKFCKSTIDKKSHNNIFFNYEKSKFILNSKNKLSIYLGKLYYVANLDELAPFVSRMANHSTNLVKCWNSTTIKYFLISVYACKYENRKPFAQSLIHEDLGVSISTIKRSLNTFGVLKNYKTQIENSPRSFFIKPGKLKNLTPNFNHMPVGKNIKYKY